MSTYIFLALTLINVIIISILLYNFIASHFSITANLISEQIHGIGINWKEGPIIYINKSDSCENNEKELITAFWPRYC
jgi:hypothetical protein